MNITIFVLILYFQINPKCQLLEQTDIIMFAGTVPSGAVYTDNISNTSRLVCPGYTLEELSSFQPLDIELYKGW